MSTRYYIAIALLILAACKGNPENKDLDVHRAEHKTLVNEVEVITLKKTDFMRQLLSNGKLSAESRCNLSFSSAGELSQVNVRNGQFVTKGQILATVDRPDLRLALESAMISLQKAEMALFDYLVGQGYSARDTLSVSEDFLNTAKIKSGYASAKNELTRARHAMEGTILRAPYSGRIADLRLRKYDSSGNEPFCSLIDDSVFYVDFSIMESEYDFISPGMSVRITPYADSEFTSLGSIVSVNPSVNKSGQIIVRARIPGNKKLLDGMNVKVVVEQIIHDQMVVPRSAIVIRDNMDVLFTCSDDNKAHWVYVKIVASNSDSYVVTANSDRESKLLEGDKVIISGNLNLADKSEVVIRK